MLPNEPLRVFLQAELVRRIQANPRYSLRAFARTLGMDASLLSKILRAKRAVGKKLFGQICERLSISPDERELLLGRDPHAGADPDNRFQPLASDEFHMIADWFHFAIYEMSRVPHFRSDPSWIASALGITRNEAAAAVERLERLGLFGRDARGKFVRAKAVEMTTTNSPFTVPAFRKLQAQILQGALHALEEVPFERRDQSSMTMAIRTSQLPKAKTLIRNFRRRLSRLLETGGAPDEVYQLTVGLYPVTQFAARRSPKNARTKAR